MVYHTFEKIGFKLNQGKTLMILVNSETARGNHFSISSARLFPLSRNYYPNRRICSPKGFLKIDKIRNPSLLFNS